jgi:hypothetical protein
MTARRKSRDEKNAKPPKGNRCRSEGSINRRKGKLAEKIAAMLHEGPDVKVERNVFLPPLNGDPRGREIDVLITSSVAGYSVKFAIECKNKAGKMGVGDIDAFVGKLDDVGIPRQYGIFISVSGYKRGVASRAKAAGIRTLILTGLTEDRLSEAISRAYQYTVSLLPAVERFSIGDATIGAGEMVGFENESGIFCGSLPDLVWSKWREGKIPATLGVHEIQLPTPSGCRPIVNDKPTQLLATPTATVRIVGVVLKLTGKARRHSLIDAHDKKTDKFLLNVDFNLQRLQGRSVSFRHFFEEEKLKAWMEKRGDIRLISRVKMPRLQLLNQFYYPMSERVARIVLPEMQAYESGQSPVRPTFIFSEIEGSEIGNAWEPIWGLYYDIWSQLPDVRLAVR